MRALIATLGIGLVGCVHSPTHLLGWLDAESDEERTTAVEQAASYLEAKQRGVAVRATAAKVLARLHLPSEHAVSALRSSLLDSGEDPLVRAWCAQALGEMRSDVSLDVLIQALRAPPDRAVFEQVLEGLAKHHGILARDSRRIVEVVEGMIFAAGNLKEQPPPIYDVLGAKTRTVEVNIEVLARAVQAAASGTPESRAALYEAESELIQRLDESRGEIEAGPGAWKGRVAESIRQSRKALTLEEPRVSRLVLLGFGRWSTSPELGRPAAVALNEDGLALRLVSSPLALGATWALGRLELSSVELRRALDQGVLGRNASQPALRLLADLGGKEGEPDGVQRVLRLAEAP